MITFSINDTYLQAKCKDQSEKTKTEVNRFLKSSGFWWNKELYCWCIFGLYSEETILEKAKYLDDVAGVGIRSFRKFKSELENREWVKKLDIKLDEECFKVPALNRMQRKAIHNVITHEGFLLALKVGAGKSFISSTAFNHLQKYEVVDKLFIVSVNSMLWGWRNELLRFTNLKEEEIFVFDSKQNRNPWSNSRDHKAIIVSYDSMRVMISDIYKKNDTSEKARKFDKKYCYHKELREWSEKFMMIVDESHHISSPKSKNNKFVKGIGMLASNVVLLTGTPFRKFWNEIYQQMSVIAPDLVDNFLDKSENYQRFLNVTANLVAQHTTNIKSTNEKMKAKLEPIYNRYIQYAETDMDIETYSNKVLVKLSDKHMQFYKQASQMILENAIEEGEGFSTQQFINNYMIFSQALADPTLVINKFSEELKDFKWDIKENEKLKITKEILKEHKGDKCILWVKSPALIDILETELKKFNPICYHGKTKIPKGKTKHQYKNELIEEFNTSNKHQLLITNEMSLGTGVTITGANVSITWVLPNNYVDFDQSKGRIRRFGQKKDVYYYMLVAESTLDEVTFHNLQNRGYLNRVRTKYTHLRKDQLKSLLLGKIID